jgi:hypothetical protein
MGASPASETACLGMDSAPVTPMNRYGFKWCWPTTRCKVYAAHAAVLRALEEGATGRDVRRRVREIYALGFETMSDVAPFRCVVCRAIATPNKARGEMGRRLTLDHFVPVSSRRRRSHGTRNLLSLCLSCNSSRGARPVRLWLREKHAAGEVEDPPEVVLRRIELARRAPLCRAIGSQILQVYYPSTAAHQTGRWQRRVQQKLSLDLSDVPF